MTSSLEGEGALWARRPHNEKYENSGQVAKRSYVSTKTKSFYKQCGDGEGWGGGGTVSLN